VGTIFNVGSEPTTVTTKFTHIFAHQKYKAKFFRKICRKKSLQTQSKLKTTEMDFSLKKWNSPTQIKLECQEQD
jgi:hypothetical protein